MRFVVLFDCWLNVVSCFFFLVFAVCHLLLIGEWPCVVCCFLLLCSLSDRCCLLCVRCWQWFAVRCSVFVVGCLLSWLLFAVCCLFGADFCLVCVVYDGWLLFVACCLLLAMLG